MDNFEELVDPDQMCRPEGFEDLQDHLFDILDTQEVNDATDLNEKFLS